MSIIPLLHRIPRVLVATLDEGRRAGMIRVAEPGSSARVDACTESI
jgi:hypothetical protein